MSDLTLQLIANRKNRIDSLIWEQPDLGLSRSQIQKMIQTQGITLNGKMSFKTGFIARSGDIISLKWKLQNQQLDAVLTDKIEIVRDEANFIVLFKPPGLVVHEGAGHKGDTLTNWLLDYYFDKNKENYRQDFRSGVLTGGQDLANNTSFAADNSFLRTPSHAGGLVHRLDKDTQGLILIAKSDFSLDYFQKQFKNRQIGKSYLVILRGKLDKKIDIGGYQARYRKNVLKQIFTAEKNIIDPEVRLRLHRQWPVKGEWKFSRSLFNPLVYNPEQNLTLAEVKMFTGRMHQIRVHAEFLGFPLFQDPLYNIQTKVDLSLLADKYNSNFKLTETGMIPTDNQKWDKLMTDIFYASNSFYLLSNSLCFTAPGGEQILVEWKSSQIESFIRSNQ